LLPNLQSMIKYFTFFFFLLPFIVLSQTVVTLEQCQEWAICQSSASIQKELNTQLLKVKLDEGVIPVALLVGVGLLGGVGTVVAVIATILV